MMDLRKIFINKEHSILEAIKIIERGGNKIALVLNSSSELIGIVSDGDIRRGILNGLGLDAKVEKIMNTNFSYVEEGIERKEVFEIMKAKKINQIPVLNKNKVIKDLIFLEEYFDKKVKENKVVIMAGGKGKRLLPHTQNCPKPMIKIGNKPMLEIILENCIDSGFRNFSFSVNYLKEQIIDYFGDGSSRNIKIDYIFEDKPKGTAGSLAKISNNLDKPTLVLNGDVLSKVNLENIIDFHSHKKNDATICVRSYENTVPFGVIEVENLKVKNILEKPTFKYLVNAGIYVLEPKILQLIEQDSYLDMPDLLERALKINHKVLAYPIHEYWLDVGRPETLEKANLEWDIR